MAPNIYYGPDKYKGIVANMPKSMRKKYKGKYAGPDKYKGFINGVRPTPPKQIVKTKTDQYVNPNIVTTISNEDVRSVYEEMAAQVYSLALNEIFLYTNMNTVDGIFDDVAIISMIADQRRDFQIPYAYPPDQTFIENMYIQGNILNIQVSGDPSQHDIILEFYELQTITTITSGDYV